MIGEREVDGYAALTLVSDGADGIEAAFVPGAGMVGCSLRHRGEELLGHRVGHLVVVDERSDAIVPEIVEDAGDGRC